MAAEIITLDELLAELSRFTPPTTKSTGQRVDELCAQWGCDSNKVRIILRRAHDLGILRRGKKKHEQIDGVMRSVNCYWFEFPAKGKNKK